MSMQITTTVPARFTPIIGGIADALCLLATPAFAIMALASMAQGESAHQMMGHGGPALGGMVWMYGLMSLFHAAPWLRLVASRT